MRLWLWILLGLVYASAASAADTGIEQSYNEMYNLQFDAAHRLLAQYEAEHPDDPLGPASDAAACLFSEFHRLHILQSEFFVDDSFLLDSKKLRPDAAVKLRFDQDLTKTQRLTAAKLSLPQERANAMFAETLRLGLHADYLALIEKRNLAALSEIKQGRELAERLLSEYPSYYDANIAIGVENYLLSQKPAPLRWALRISGAETNKQKGLEKLRLTAEHGHYLLPYARLLLALAALRDREREQAREWLTWLVANYPQNNLYREELAKLR